MSERKDVVTATIDRVLEAIRRAAEAQGVPPAQVREIEAAVVAQETTIRRDYGGMDAYIGKHGRARDENKKRAAQEAGKVPVAAAAKRFGLSRSTLYRQLNNKPDPS